ncbi:hypothetical protein U1Q18_046619 [Sarracenia purpurea var. burkii]
MSQIWYYLLVSVISGLCHSAVLKTDFTDEYQIGEEITDIDVVILKNSHTGNDGSLQILGEKSTNEKDGRSRPILRSTTKSVFHPMKMMNVITPLGLARELMEMGK